MLKGFCLGTAEALYSGQQKEKEGILRHAAMNNVNNWYHGKHNHILPLRTRRRIRRRIRRRRRYAHASLAVCFVTVAWCCMRVHLGGYDVVVMLASVLKLTVRWRQEKKRKKSDSDSDSDDERRAKKHKD